MGKFRKFSSDHIPPGNIWVLGAGHFGYLACKRLIGRYPDAALLVIDADEDNLAKIQQEFGLPVHLEEAVSFLNTKPLADDIWIIPAVPVHVAFQWLLSQLGETDAAVRIDVPPATDQQVPNPYRMDSRTLYASFATFVCPDACSEPDELCTHTGKPRPGNLYERLQQLAVPGFQVAVVRSRQLAPGVGGYPGAALNGTLAAIKRAPGSYLVATSCRCHGVVDALRWEAKPG